MAIDTDKPLNGTPEPFRRPVIWGRPPATVFRAGPLPKGAALPPRPEAPRLGTAAGILSGSMIPRATPAPAVPVPAPTQVAAEPRVARAAPPRDHAADLTVRPLPALKPEPVVAAAALKLDALPAFQPTVRSEADAASPAPAGPKSVRKAVNRTPIYAGIAVATVAVLALGAWILTRSPAAAPAPVTVAPATTPVPEIPVPPVIAAEISTDAAVPVTPAARPTAAAPVATRAPAPVVSRAAPPPPEIIAPPPATTPAPPIVIVQPPGPLPTEAERPPADPDAPVATRPQPLG